jgi:ribonuclease Z
VGQLGAMRSCSILVDCGEGTVPALRRCIGVQQAHTTINSLVAVFISHKHADHCLGFPAVLQMRPAHLKPLLAVVPAAVQVWLQESHSHLMSRVRFVHCSAFAGTNCGGGADRSSNARERGIYAVAGKQNGRAGTRGGEGSGGVAGAATAMSGAGFVAWACPRVRHCYDSFGLVLEHDQGWKLVFSGDTMPSGELERLGCGATLLVHEATFDDSRSADAAAKRHSTIGQALSSAEAMGAWRVLLTHFSQRYSRYAPAIWGCAPDAGSSGPEAALRRATPVFDGMLVPFTALHGLPALSRAMMGYLTEERCDVAKQLFGGDRI